MGNRKKWVTSGQNLIDCRDAEEDFRDEGLSQGEQFGDAADNLRLINDAEKVFEEEHAFEAPEEIPPFPSHQVWSLKFTAFEFMRMFLFEVFLFEVFLFEVYHYQMGSVFLASRT